MIETLMALWNWGMRGRLMVMVVTFFCISISISLLFVTVGSAWGSLFARGRTSGEVTRVVNSVMITATASISVVITPVEATPTSVPNPCLASPTGQQGHTSLVDTTRSSGRTGVPTVRVSATPVRRQKTPVPGVTVTPALSPLPSLTPSPTLPAVTPTVMVSPTATILPTVTPTVISTPTVTGTFTPTVGITPTDTSTPGATATPPTSTPTVTATPGVTPTAIVSPTAMGPASSPTVLTSVTPGIGSRHGHGGGPLTTGTPSSGNNNQPGQGNCFSDTLVVSGEGAVISLLQNFFWVILVSSLLGTALFCAQMYRVSRNFRP